MKPILALSKNPVNGSKCMGCASGNTDWLTLAREVLDIEIQGLEAIIAQLDGEFVRGLTAMAQCKGRVVITGVGKNLSDSAGL